MAKDLFRCCLFIFWVFALGTSKLVLSRDLKLIPIIFYFGEIEFEAIVNIIAKTSTISRV